VNVGFATADGTATLADSDYTGLTGTLCFAGEANETQTITVSTTADAKVEADETFLVSLWNVVPQGAGVSAANFSTPGSPATGTITNDDTPRVSGVYVRGTDWASQFAEYVDPARHLGYPIPVGSTVQLKTLPWINLNQIVIRFSDNVDVQQADMTLNGTQIASYAFSDFQYDSSSFTATWTLSQTITNDKLLIHLDGTSGAAVHSVDNVLALDGEWTNGSSVYPSGNATAGGDFLFRFNVLAGDVNQSNSVLGSDVIYARDRQFMRPGDALYDALADVNGSAIILGNDVVAIRDLQFTWLVSGPDPVGMPVPDAAPSQFASSVQSAAASPNSVLATSVTAAIGDVATVDDSAGQVQTESSAVDAGMDNAGVLLASSQVSAPSSTDGGSDGVPADAIPVTASGVSRQVAEDGVLADAPPVAQAATPASDFSRAPVTIVRPTAVDVVMAYSATHGEAGRLPIAPRCYRVAVDVVLGESTFDDENDGNQDLRHPGRAAPRLATGPTPPSGWVQSKK